MRLLGMHPVQDAPARRGGAGRGRPGPAPWPGGRSWNTSPGTTAPAAKHARRQDTRRIRRTGQDQEGSLIELSALSVKPGQPQRLRLLVAGQQQRLPSPIQSHLVISLLPSDRPFLRSSRVCCQHASSRAYRRLLVRGRRPALITDGDGHMSRWAVRIANSGAAGNHAGDAGDACGHVQISRL